MNRSRVKKKGMLVYVCIWSYMENYLEIILAANVQFGYLVISSTCSYGWVINIHSKTGCTSQNFDTCWIIMTSPTYMTTISELMSFLNILLFITTLKTSFYLLEALSAIHVIWYNGYMNIFKICICYFCN